MEDPHLNDVSQPTGPLEPLPGHDELLLTDPALPPSVPAPVPEQIRRSVAMKRSGKVARAIADDDDDSDEEDDDYAPPTAKSRRTEESEDRVASVSSVVNSPELTAPPSVMPCSGEDPPVSGELALPRPVVVVKRRKTMDDNVGPRFQADVPDFPLLPEERGKDRREELAGELQWQPTPSISNEHLSRFLLALDGAEDSLSVEKALNMLRERHCDYKSVTLDVLYGPPGLNLQRRRRRDILNKEEQRQFKEAMSVVGKDFHQIAKCMHRSVHDLIDYYYLWKKQRKFHASAAHVPYAFYVDPTIRLPRLADTSSGAAVDGPAAATEDSEGSGESSASCKQS